MKNRLLAGFLIAAVLSIGMIGCGIGGTKDAEQNSAQESEVVEEKENIGTFTTQDIYGNEVTEAIFSEYDLTLVNMFATWCGPCVNEMPDLAQLQKDMNDKKVNIIAVVLDAGAGDQIDENVVATAQELAEIANAEMTFMIPDAGFMNGRMENVSAVPESFFVDSQGNIVSEPYVGARNYDKWAKIIEFELGKLQTGE